MVPDFTGDVTASDNCTTVGNLVITQSPAAGTTVTTGVNVVTITVTDQAGNETSCDVNFTVVDNTDPVITSCATAESADADGSCEALVPDFTGDVTASDNCTTVGNLVITQSPAAGTTVTTGVNVVTITVTDQAGNETSCDVNFTVVDNTDPVITSCATAESADADGSCEALVPDFTGDVTASDNCTTVGNLVITQSPAAGTTVTTGVNVVTITVTDQAGNETSCDVNFTVVDNTDPVITSCATAESAHADGSCEALVPDFTGDVTASDNCTEPLEIWLSRNLQQQALQ